MKPAFALLVATLALVPATSSDARSRRVGTYTNSNGRHVSGPKRSLLSFFGAKAKCRDGSHSYSRHTSGTCSGHGGLR